jgi:hypothetical protein
MVNCSSGHAEVTGLAAVAIGGAGAGSDAARDAKPSMLVCPCSRFAWLDQG